MIVRLRCRVRAAGSVAHWSGIAVPAISSLQQRSAAPPLGKMPARRPGVGKLGRRRRDARRGAAAPSDVVIDYTKPHAVNGHAWLAAAAMHVVIGTSASPSTTMPRSTAASRRPRRACSLPAISRSPPRSGDASRWRLPSTSRTSRSSTTHRRQTRRSSLDAQESARAACRVVDLASSRSLTFRTAQTRGAAMGSPVPVQIHSRA